MVCYTQEKRVFPEPQPPFPARAIVALSHRRALRRFIGLWLLLLLSLPPVYGQDLREADYLFQRARRRYLKGELDGAITDLTKVIELTTRLQPKGRPERLFWNWLEAAASEGRAIGVIDPRAAPAYTLRGIARHDRQNYEGALSDFNHALRIAPRYAGAYGSRALTYRAKGELELALQDYNRALQLDPRYVDAYNNRGVLLEEQGKLREALADFDAAIQITDREAAIFGNRGRARRSARDSLGSIADFNRAIELDPKVAWFYLGRGIARFDQNQLDRALADFDQAIKLDAQIAEAYANRGLLQLLHGNEAAAEADFARCLAWKPELRPVLEQQIAKTNALRAKNRQDK